MDLCWEFPAAKSQASSDMASSCPFGGAERQYRGAEPLNRSSSKSREVGRKESWKMVERFAKQDF